MSSTELLASFAIFVSRIENKKQKLLAFTPLPEKKNILVSQSTVFPPKVYRRKREEQELTWPLFEVGNEEKENILYLQVYCFTTMKRRGKTCNTRKTDSWNAAARL
jgi:hypothetical protein